MVVRPHERFSNLTATILTISFVALFIVAAWSVYFLWVRFQVVQLQTLDYAVLAVIALGVPLWVYVRKARREQQSVWGIVTSWSTAKSYLAGALITGAIGGAVLELANGFLDSHEPTVFMATVVHRCYRGSLGVKGAPTVPTTSNTMDLETFPFGGMDCHATHIGDTILIAVKSGHLRRPWVSGYRLQSPSDSTMLRRTRVSQTVSP